jgi:hypothetical protein
MSSSLGGKNQVCIISTDTYEFQVRGCDDDRDTLRNPHLHTSVRVILLTAVPLAYGTFVPAGKQEYAVLSRGESESTVFRRLGAVGVQLPPARPGRG